MRLFLSSLRLGNHPERLRALVRPGAGVAVVGNALDAWPERARQNAVTSEFPALRAIGLEPVELDLRDFIGAPDRLRGALEHRELIWVRGGNTFVLRVQLARSGADAVIAESLARDALAYGGYSAGACVAGPSLAGLESVDDPAEVAAVSPGSPVRWDGLGLIEHRVVPHFGTPGYPEEDAIRRIAADYAAAGIAHHRLGDGHALVVDGAHAELR
ncbi:type 1 glutamine amidotransferase-like domain-containing protein [Rhodococcus sp. D2-41]|uniref:Type 1 glutamine amidotransferase-like domain-containing protein n=1 Tax=Speluncibacter jeojiensis TaxID=2710754 RepID=A0A9X4M686_9ACTN|nr:Type 1 glutamine amidotransferase-like domain-containing protein [Rhodococcus sp. D2-41]MDG3012683.1 type 1 glutamine amidotransferase-like domain-containing protein [Rhodococcus sp. D2-41]MDG3015211.1 Type 1 glutamine amidotransferase-like domain-containing protein [Corynebacteriales bacterium D3-21]